MPGLPEPPALESEGARFRLFEAASSFLRSAARARPLVLMLDDLHAADEPSLLLLRFLAREMPDSRLLVVCAFRDVDPALRDPLTATLAELVREPHTAQIGLAGLSDVDVAEYIELSTGIEPRPGWFRRFMPRQRAIRSSLRRWCTCWMPRAASPTQTRTCGSRRGSAR